MNVTQIQECILPCHNIITAFHIYCLEQIKGARVSFSCFKNIPGRWGLGCMHFGDNLPISERSHPRPAFPSAIFADIFAKMIFMMAQDHFSNIGFYNGWVGFGAPKMYVHCICNICSFSLLERKPKSVIATTSSKENSG